jgi:sec-independent protein translocase protein TatA
MAGGTELIIVLVVVLIFFGASRIPSLARSLGSGMSEFRKGVSEGQNEAELEGEEKGEDGVGEEKDLSGEEESDESPSRSSSEHKH